MVSPPLCEPVEVIYVMIPCTLEDNNSSRETITSKAHERIGRTDTELVNSDIETHNVRIVMPCVLQYSHSMFVAHALGPQPTHKSLTDTQ